MAAPPPPPSSRSPEPADRARPGRRRVPLEAHVKVLASFGFALLIAVLVPRLAGDGSRPPAAVLLTVGLLVGGATAAAMYSIVRRDLGLGKTVALYAFGYTALVVLVKFVFAPDAVYDVNRTVPFESLFPLSDPFGAIVAGVFVFVLYAAVYYLLYRVSRTGAAARKADPRRTRRTLVALTAGALFVAVSGAGAVLLLPLFAIESGLVYLEFVFSSGLSLLIAGTLAAATWLASRVFAETADRAQVVADGAVLVSVLWVGLYFLALYHGLWVVYVLVLTAVWPLKVVVPK